MIGCAKIITGKRRVLVRSLGPGPWRWGNGAKELRKNNFTFSECATVRLCIFILARSLRACPFAALRGHCVLQLNGGEHEVDPGVSQGWNWAVAGLPEEIGLL